MATLALTRLLSRRWLILATIMASALAGQSAILQSIHVRKAFGRTFATNVNLGACEPKSAALVAAPHHHNAFYSVVLPLVVQPLDVRLLAVLVAVYSTSELWLVNFGLLSCNMVSRLFSFRIATLNVFCRPPYQFMPHRIRYLLIQIRNASDPMLLQEVDCFARALGVPTRQIETHDLLSGAASNEQLEAIDAILIGGSGDYSVVQGGPWLPRALTFLRDLVEFGKPMFASCWGFQALSKALGGEVVTDLNRAEVGTLEVTLTPQGSDDVVFGSCGNSFLATMGHQDIVMKLPPGAIHLARSQRVENQAFRIAGKPIYGTQFHPELDLAAFLARVRAYPQYVESIVGIPYEEFERGCQETPQSNRLLTRFAASIAPTRQAS